MLFVIGRFRVRYPGVRTLKERRRRLKRFQERARQRLNISLIDVSGSCAIEEAGMAYCFAALNGGEAERLVEKLEGMLADSETQVLSFEKRFVVWEDE